MKDVQDRVIGIIVDSLGCNESQVSLDAAFTDDLGADSLEMVNLMMALEEEFDIQIPDEDVESKIVTVKDSVEYIKKRLEEK